MVEFPLGVLVAPGIYPDLFKVWLAKWLLCAAECMTHASFWCEVLLCFVAACF